MLVTVRRPDRASFDFGRLARLSKEGAWIVVGQAVAVAGTLAGVRVLTEYLSPTDYGQLALWLTLALLVNQVLMGGIGQGISRFFAIARESDDLRGYLEASCRLLVKASMVTVALGLALALGLDASGYDQWIGLAMAVMAFAILSGWNGGLSAIQNAARQRQIVALHSGMDAWLKVLLAVGAILWLGQSATAVLIGYAASAMLVTISQAVFLHRAIPSHSLRKPAAVDEKTWDRPIWQFSWPFSLWGIFTWMQQASDRWALEAFASTQDLGLYAILFQLGYAPIMIVAGLAANFLAPIFYQRSGDATSLERNANVHALTWRVAALTFGLTVLSCLIALNAHELIFRLLVAEGYRSVSYLLPWMVLAGGLFVTGQMLSLRLMSQTKSRQLLAPKVVTAIFGVGMNLAGAAIAGTHGVVAALVGFSATYVLWMAWLARSQLPELSLTAE